MNEELICRIALTMIPDLGPVRIKSLIDHYTLAAAVFAAPRKELACIENMNTSLSRAIKNCNAFKKAEMEINFLQQHQIKPLFITDQDYPQRLLHCYDPPSLLYYKGKANLNHAKLISIIGTRSQSAYGKSITEALITALAPHKPIIVSGLAFGIDAIAHKIAVQCMLPTIGVLGHGLDTLYPSQHRSLAKTMLQDGGLLTEYRMGTQPDRHNFPKRNRIVAGMTDATIVIETGLKGGSMITAELACNYNRDVFAVPGKITDNTSAGCLQLIQQNKAIVYTHPEHLIEMLGWKEKKKNLNPQKELFIELTQDEKKVVSLLNEKTTCNIDELYIQSGLSSSRMASIILQLELKNIIRSLPGKMYALV